MIQLHFFDKEHILISRKYQLHPASATTECLSDNTNAQKKRGSSSDQFSVAAVINLMIPQKRKVLLK
jgi:hypothetical protein